MSAHIRTRRFCQIGVAFPQKDGAESHMKIILEALPLNGELVLFEPRAGDYGA